MTSELSIDVLCSSDGLSCWCLLALSVIYFFFFKQKTAYEMRISDWSSDVCSSDLVAAHGDAIGHRDGIELDRRAAAAGDAGADVPCQVAQCEIAGRNVGPGMDDGDERPGDGRVVESGCPQHGPGGGSGRALLDGVHSLCPRSGSGPGSPNTKNHPLFWRRG